jgi:hypothetical protein
MFGVRSQLVEPELLPGDVRASLQSEYNTSYNTKSDNIELNQAVVFVASTIDRKRTTAQVKTSVLSKMVNALTKTIPYPLVMSAAYLLGFGDSWCPIQTARHDFALFQRRLLQRDIPYDNNLVDHVFAEVESSDNDEDDDGEAASDDGRTSVKAIDAAMQYRHRHASLDDWSPFELTMGFVFGAADTEEATLFPLSGPFEGRGYAHRPRRNRARQLAMVVPQPGKEHPRRPAEDAPPTVREEYAAWALGNFYSDRLMDKLAPTDAADADGSVSLWGQFRRWENSRPRGDKDEFALRCISNIELRLEARSLMGRDSKQLRLLRRQILETAEDAGGDIGTDHDSSDEEDFEVSELSLQ